MTESEKKNFVDIKMDGNNLYREEVFTDGKVGAIRRLSPISLDGAPDDSREPLFMGNTQLIAPNGQPVPVQCPIEAKGLAEAISEFPAAVNRAVEQIMMQAARQMEAEKESPIIVPGS
jgi:hypothetical protein